VPVLRFEKVTGVYPDATGVPAMRSWTYSPVMVVPFTRLLVTVMLLGAPVVVVFVELTVPEAEPEAVCAAVVPITDMPLTKKMSANMRVVGMIHFWNAGFGILV
jgi:hypothetical protein